jgi:uncharacterized protein (DUF2126 family)
MSVTRIHESPRVTMPYSEPQWNDILSLGERVDQQLVAHDVRLTMGGEPTFVANSDRDAAEWNTDALGPTKRNYATQLVHLLREEYGEGGFVHFGQGKWYPGEQLPRWALGIYWRADGKPCWEDVSLFADESKPSEYSVEDAHRFVNHLAIKLGLVNDFVTPGYEDTWYYLWRERRLPVNVDPFDSKLDDELERIRLRRVFSQKLDAVVGYLLPLAPSDRSMLKQSPWTTGPWLVRDERLYLIPGDSPMGYRLPLDSLPWVNKSDYPYQHAIDPFEHRSPLPQASFWRQQHQTLQNPDQRAETVEAKSTEPERFQSDPSVVRTALCVEVRDPQRANGPKGERTGNHSGVIYVFMPPLNRLEDYLSLLTAVESTAQELRIQIVLEGYPPPRDPRLKVLQVTPDPGVIEVNIHPAHQWRELVHNTEFLYRAAFETRLTAEKFMIDGRHTGTGGGNHFVLGGATPSDSPFLRRPELLASLILYWHNHPSLSYLFSGMFIGPTSQAPRVDEARNDQIYELEIALQEITRQRAIHGQDMPPWLVDRTLRNILIDVTGNTHRSEFCIDKLYSPDSSTGRLGLLELRAFEMPPHAQMSIVQQLLLRALIARFWKSPYRAPATRWGTQLHDRFLLPTFVEMDFADVIREMNESGFDFDKAWFAPHFEFRFPRVGDLKIQGMVMTLRNALEPWHVMGEEGAVGGTVRYVDSSLERIEVRINGFNESRYVITVNGRALPLQPTGTEGDFVAGIRYRAWSPPSALHPTLGTDAPLTFDFFDTWSGRSIGGCQYHVAHPGGRNYVTYPVNAYEAESRRLARFFRHGHTPGSGHVPEATVNIPGSREFPFTLDLRRWQN